MPEISIMCMMIKYYNHDVYDANKITIFTMTISFMTYCVCTVSDLLDVCTVNDVPDSMKSSVHDISDVFYSPDVILIETSVYIFGQIVVEQKLKNLTVMTFLTYMFFCYEKNVCVTGRVSAKDILFLSFVRRLCFTYLHYIFRKLHTK